MLKLVAATAVAGVWALAVATRSDALVCCTSQTYFSGYLAPTQGAASAYDDLCNNAYSSSQAQTPGAYYSTVALIDRSGGWRRSFRSNQSYVYVFVDPNTEAGARAYSKKAYCKNSDNAFSYALSCNVVSWYRPPGEICV